MGAMTAASAPVVVSDRTLSHGRVVLRPLAEVDNHAWRRLHAHFRDPEIAYLNGTPPTRLPLWLLRRVLRSDSRRPDRRTYGIFDEQQAFIGTIELYEVRGTEAVLGIIIGERTHWGRGYGNEAIRALLGYGFGSLGLEIVRLHTFADNLRAQAAFNKVGFRENRRVPAANGRTDVQMSITRGAFYAREGGAGGKTTER